MSDQVWLTICVSVNWRLQVKREPAMPREKDAQKETLSDKFKPLLDRLDSYPRNSVTVDKQFYDNLWEEPKGDFSKTDLA